MFNVMFPDEVEDMLCLDIEDDEIDSECEEFYRSEVENKDDENDSECEEFYRSEVESEDSD